MKKQLVVLAVLIAVILFCLGVAVVKSNDQKALVKAATDSKVRFLQEQLAKNQTILTHHDQVNQVIVKNSADQILVLQQEKTTLCTQIKTAKLVQPLCP